MVTTKRRLAVGLAASAVAAGCYDAPTVDPYPSAWLIDNFDDGDGYPSSPLFEHWECRPEDPTHPISACEIVPDPDSGALGVLHLRSQLWPMDAGKDDFTRSEVATFAKKPLDLTHYARLAFRAKLVPDASFAPILRVLFSCTDVQPKSGGLSRNPCVVLKAPTYPDVGWHDLTLDLGMFSAPELEGEQKVLRDDCLAKVDAIKITVDSNGAIEKGTSSTFDLYVDDIALSP